MRIYWVLILLIINTSHAILVEDLYNAEVEVPSRSISVEQKNSLIKQEFAKVLKKITGKSQSLLLEEEDVEKYVGQYEYKDHQLENNKIILKIYFDKALINKALIENQHSFLDEHRPLIIIWPKTSTAVISDPIQELLQQISLLAKEHGLPIVYPILDLKEVEILNRDVIDDDLIDSIKHASKKYVADEIIIAEFNIKDDLLNITWRSVLNDWQITDQLLDHDNINNQNLSSANLFVNKLTEQVMHHYVGSNDKLAKELILMKINNVINLEDYVRVEKYLQNLSVINNLHATLFQAGEVEFKIVASGGKQAIKNAISTNNFLRENYKDTHADDNRLFYTLQFS